VKTENRNQRAFVLLWGQSPEDAIGAQSKFAYVKVMLTGT